MAKKSKANKRALRDLKKTQRRSNLDVAHQQRRRDRYMDAWFQYIEKRFKQKKPEFGSRRIKPRRRWFRRKSSGQFDLA